MLTDLIGCGSAYYGETYTICVRNDYQPYKFDLKVKVLKARLHVN
jgi:hypothetical protein